MVLGAGGQLGCALAHVTQRKKESSGVHREIAFVKRGDFEVGLHEPHCLLDTYHPTVVINAAAYTAVDRAESEREQAFLVNGEGVEQLSFACGEAGVRLIHVSTDYVFDGKSSSPLVPDDPTGPLNVYGESKLAGENHVLALGRLGTVVRTSWLYSPWGGNFFLSMGRILREKASVGVVFDQTASPTSALSLARVLLCLAGDGGTSGLFHYADAGVGSWFDFACAIRKHLAERGEGTVGDVRSIRTRDFPRPAVRPAFTVLDSSLLLRAVNIQQPWWQEALDEVVRVSFKEPQRSR